MAFILCKEFSIYQNCTISDWLNHTIWPLKPVRNYLSLETKYLGQMQFCSRVAELMPRKVWEVHQDLTPENTSPQTQPLGVSLTYLQMFDHVHNFSSRVWISNQPLICHIPQFSKCQHQFL